MKENLKNQKGITIISLVITIIVMIIIASISINMGLSSINSTQDSSIETNLEIVQQAITQQYSKAMTLDNLDIESNINGIAGEEEDDTQKPNTFIGTPLTQDELKDFLEKHPNAPDLINIDKSYNYDNTDYEDIYYLISENELNELGIDVAKGQEYIINYSTGEVLDITNETYTSGSPAYINGFTSMLEVDEEAFVDTPINISIYEELTKTADGYKFSIKVTDEIAKITPEGTNSEGNKLTSTNDPDDLNENDIITENIVITGTDPDTPATDGVTITKTVKPDPSQGIGEHYIYEIEIKDETGIIDPTNPSITIEIKPDSVIDDEGNGNAITELTTSDDSVDVENVQFDFTLGNVKYYAKDLNGEMIDGITIGDDQWGSSASVDLTITTDDIKGLNKNTYIFEYIWSLEENVNWENAKTVSVTSKQGASKAKSTLYLEGYTGKGYLHVKPSTELLTSSGKEIESTEKTIPVNLDCTPPEIKVFYEDENGNEKDINEFLSQEDAFLRFYLTAIPPAYGHSSPNITYKFIDNESGIYTDENSSLHSAHLFYQKNQNPKEIKDFTVHPNDEPYTQWYGTNHTKQNESGFGSEDGFLKWYKNFHLLYTSNLPSGEYNIAFATNPTLLNKEIYLIDNCGNKLKDMYTIGPIKVDSVAPEIKSIEISDDGNTIIHIKDDYSGLEIDYSKIKYAWIKESTIPDDVEWKSVTEEQIKQKIKNTSTKNIAELKIDIGTPDDTEEYYLAVKLDSLKDIAGNTADTTLVSEETAKKDVFEFRLENLQYVSTDEYGDIQDGATVGNDTWGTSATVDLVLSSTGKKGLKAGNYQFEYIWTTEENYNWDTNGIKTAVLAASNGLASTTFPIKIDSYTGKGYLHVRPKEEYKSAAGVKLDTTQKNVIMNLDNIAPEFYVKYKNENGVYEDLENLVGDEDFYLRKGKFVQDNSASNSYFKSIPDLRIGFKDSDCGINATAHLPYDLAKCDEIDEHLSLYGTKDIIDICHPDPYYGVGTIQKDKYGYPIAAERHVEFLETLLNSSGEYYFILFESYTLARSLNVVDNVGNKILEPKIVGPLKVDSITPEITDISMNDEGNVQIYLNDDYSGLTTDYSKIKYAWVKNKSTVPTSWSNSVSSDQIEIDTYNEYNKPTDIIATIGIPPEEGKWYLAVKMEGYKDIAGNAADDTITYSEESFGFADDLVIEVFEEDGLDYPKEVQIKITSTSGDSFKLNSIGYEHKGLNDRQNIEGINLEITDEFSTSYYTTVNGPIIVYAEDIYENEFSTEYMVKNVQGTELVYNVTESELVLPIMLSEMPDPDILIYINWEKEDGEFTEGEYLTQSLYSLKTDGTNVFFELNTDTSAYHMYNELGEKHIRITGTLTNAKCNRFDYSNKFYNSNKYIIITYEAEENIDIVNSKLDISKKSLKSIELFGKHGTVNGNQETSSNWNGAFSGCENLESLPIQYEEYCAEAFENVQDISNMFKETKISRLDMNFLKKAKNLSTLSSTFYGCENLNYINEDFFENCSKIESFEKTFASTGFSTLPSNLFSENTSVESFYYTFNNCINLKTIPDKLFEKNINVTNFEGTFRNCKNLESIPSNLFNTNINVGWFRRTFEACSTLTEIPEKLFENNIMVSDFNAVFIGCEKITEIPEKLFSKNINVTNFCSAFEGVKGIEEIPELLFVNNLKVTNFSKVFCGNVNLKNIPERIFEKNTEVILFNSAFSSCSKIDYIPEKLFINNKKVRNFSSVFANTNISSIYKDIFISSKDNIQDLSGVFYGCENLKLDLEANKEMFKDYKNVTDFSEIFFRCSSIDYIPKDLFLNCSSAEDFSRAFAYSGVVEIDSSFWGGNVSVKLINEMFRSCVNLKNVNTYNDIGIFENINTITNAELVFASCIALEKVNSKTFVGCNNIQKIGGIFYNCKNLNTFGYNAFADMKESVNSISYIVNTSIPSYYGAFEGCLNLVTEECPPLYDWEKFVDCGTNAYNAFYGSGVDIASVSPWNVYYGAPK